MAAAVIVPLSASAQGVPGGVERGAREGERAAGPVGAIVGGTVGGGYTVVNDRPVLVDPRTRRIVEVVE